MPKIFISTCLLNIKTQWDGDCKNYPELRELVKQGKAIFACPEQLGGLPTPRYPCEIEHTKTAKNVLTGTGKVMSKEGIDTTKEFVQGAKYVLGICKDFGIEYAILKAKSPSCGAQQTYDGTFTGVKIPGKGILAELLEQNGIKVYDETNFPKSLLELA
ncbi:MAG: DUF523 domain-containing protein [Patescibacteria group bacterium]